MSESKKQSSKLDVKDGFLFCEIAHYTSSSVPKIDYDALGIRPPEEDSDVEFIFRDAAFALSQIDAFMQITDDSEGFPRMMIILAEDKFIAKGLVADIKVKLI
jgi:hypothetical protein